MWKVILLKIDILTEGEVRQALDSLLLNRPNPDPSSEAMEKFLVPYEKNEQFMCREALLLNLRTTLSEVSQNEYNHRVALYGMGGVGKTQTAIAYVYAYRSKYDRTYWISAANEASLLSGFRDIAVRSRCVASVDKLDPRNIAARVLAWLRQQENWLVVVDNLDEIDLVEGLLPERAPNRHTLITTRNPNSEGIPARGLEVPLLEVPEGIKMLYALAKLPRETEPDAAQKIVETLGCLPLAIGQAASYVREVSRSFIAFLETYHKRRKELHEWIPRGNRQYSKSLASTWSMSFDFLKEHHPSTAKLLQYLAFLNPDHIWLEFLQVTKAPLDDDMKSLLSDNIELAKALLSLERFSLIKWSREHQSVSIHRLVQAAMKDRLLDSEMDSFSSTIVEMCGVIYNGRVSNETLASFQRYQGQVLIPLLQLDRLPPTKVYALSAVYGSLADFLLHERKLDDCGRLISLLERLYSTVPEIDEAQMFFIRVRLCELYRFCGRSKEALEFAEQNLIDSVRLWGEDDLISVQAIQTLAATYIECRLSYEESIELLEKAVSKRLLLCPDPDQALVRSIINLGDYYRRVGRMKEAIMLQEEALSCSARIGGDEDLETIRSMAKLGWTYYMSGRYEDAAKLLEECLSKHIRTYGEGNPRVWRATQSLCDAYLEIGRFDAAADLLDKLVPDSRISFGDGARRTLVSEASLAEAFWGQGQSEEAAELLDKLFQKCKRLLVGPVYGLDELGSLWDICGTFRRLNKVHEAAELLENMMKRTIALVGSEHAKTIKVVERLCKAYDALEKLDLAIELRETSLPAIKKVFGETSDETLRVTQALLKNYQATNRLREASALESELETIKVFRQDVARPERKEPKTVNEIFERLKQKYPLQNPPAETRIVVEKKAPQLNLFQASRKILSAPSKWVPSLTKRR